jgi:hypothetical protein
LRQVLQQLAVFLQQVFLLQGELCPSEVLLLPQLTFLLQSAPEDSLWLQPF